MSEPTIAEIILTIHKKASKMALGSELTAELTASDSPTSPLLSDTLKMCASHLRELLGELR